jgi:hypothetical protein
VETECSERRRGIFGPLDDTGDVGEHKKGRRPFADDPVSVPLAELDDPIIDGACTFDFDRVKLPVRG